MVATPIAISPSSNIAAVEWDSETRDLTVDFASGDRYIYAQVPESVATGFSSAPSPGQYFYRHIRQVYSYERA